MMVWVILNTNGAVWGSDCFASEDIARAELHHFFKDKKVEEKFKVKSLETRAAITGDYAGMGTK